MSAATWGKTEIRNAVAERSGLPASTVDAVLAALSSVVVEQVSKGTKLQIPGIAVSPAHK